MTRETNPLERQALRATFEEFTRNKFKWTNFRRNEDVYECREVQLCWYWLNIGFFAGKGAVADELEFE